mgnify:CR=1 FL=1
MAAGGVARAVTIPADVTAQHPWGFLRLRADCDDNNNTFTSTNDHFLPSPGGFELARSKLHPPDCATSDWALEGKSCAFNLHCARLALFVVLDTAGELGPGRFSDGSFAIVPVLHVQHRLVLLYQVTMAHT